MRSFVGMLKKSICSFLLIFTIVFLKGCDYTDNVMQKIPVVLDTDIGTDIDDMWALIMILNSPEFDVKLITTSVDDTEVRTKLVAKILEIAGRTDIPIGMGSQNAINPAPVRQRQWVENYDLSKYPGTIHKNGVEAMVKTILDSKEPVKIIAIAPLPTIEAALELEPRITQNAQFIGMQGSIKYPFEGAVEYNVQIWPSGMQKVLAADWKKTITPLDTCGKIKLEGQRYKNIVNRDSKLTNALIEAYTQWYQTDETAEPNSPIPQTISSILYDTVAVYLAISEDLVNIEELPIRATADGKTLVDNEKGSLVRCAMSWKDMDSFKEFVVERITR